MQFVEIYLKKGSEKKNVADKTDRAKLKALYQDGSYKNAKLPP